MPGSPIGDRPPARESWRMLSSTSSRLAAFAASLAIAAGAAAAVGAATDATPPFQDCLKVAAAGPLPRDRRLRRRRPQVRGRDDADGARLLRGPAAAAPVADHFGRRL